MTCYCGSNENLPESYDRFATRYECLRKGFGICKYNGKLGSKEVVGKKKKKSEKIYCGNDLLLPEGYDRYANRYECLKRGYGICLYSKKKN